MDLNSINRRRMLRGMGAAIALPALDIFRPGALAAAPRAATTASGAPLRMAYLYFPNGAIMDSWRPSGEGTNFRLNGTMESLKPFQKQLQVMTGFEHKNGWAGPDGAGDHARAHATILTGARARKTAGANIRLGVSVDQVAAQAVGGETRLSSLELSTDSVRKTGNCDSGYSCAYQFNLAWRNEVTPMAPEHNPRLAFERLFGSGNAAERGKNLQARTAQKRSILDFVMSDAKSLHNQLGRNDQQKLDEYLTGVRELEKRIEKTEQFGQAPMPEMAAPAGVPESFGEHIRLMIDLVVLAFETDTTRIATFALSHDGSNRRFPEVGVSEAHHGLSHHRRDAYKMRQIAKIDRFYADQFGYYLKKMAAVKDVDGKSLLDNSMTVYASGLSDANSHAHNDLPVILAGNAGGALSAGRHIKYRRDTPMSNLYVSMLNTMGVPAKSFGDSTDPLRDI
jgi:hypothetical protein